MIDAVHTKLLSAWSSVDDRKALKTSLFTFSLFPLRSKLAGTCCAGTCCAGRADKCCGRESTILADRVASSCKGARLPWGTGSACPPLGAVELGLPVPSRGRCLGVALGDVGEGRGEGSASVERRNSRTRASIS